MLAPAVWKQAPDSAPYELGLKYQFFATNADIPRRDAAKEFLDTVGGLSYLPPGQFAVELDEQVRNLYQPTQRGTISTLTRKRWFAMYRKLA